ncbi:MAG: DUF5107 domain-containing protein [Fimbriimonadales bacterium]
MARVTLSEFVMPSADLGPRNPHAALFQAYAPVAHYEGQDIPVDHALPYRALDGYDRDLKPRAHRVAILESDRLKATFLLDLGGRLWSLIHKPTRRELIYANPVFQPANFGIRNAWFSGGIEWNMGLFGHCVFTCVPVFAAETVAPDGTAGIRFWEYERTRGFAWQVDVWAPEGSDFLYWSPRITNPHDRTIPMYWWTCLTVTEEPGGRVLAPSRYAIEPDHAMGDIPVRHDLWAEPDLTYPQKRDLPRDTYFEIPEGERPWIAHVSAGGDGVLHLSSPRLAGRKQWVWGMEHCGRRWQDWLSPGGPPYIEIQGGLAKKQSDYVPMPAGADWTWLEAYGPFSGVDSSDWRGAVEQVDRIALEALPTAGFQRREAQMREAVLVPPQSILRSGSGWGALEVERRSVQGLLPLCGPEVPFPVETIGPAQHPWHRLLHEGVVPDWDPAEAPGGYVGSEWRGLLEGIAESTESAWSWLHLGVVFFQDGNRKAARQAWERSFKLRPNGWALRNIGVLDKLEGDLARASDHILEACGLLPGQPQLVDEACRILAEAGDFDRLECFLESLPSGLEIRPRVRLARAQAALHRGCIGPVRAYFDSPCDLVDIREAETTVSELWRGLCEADPSCGDTAFPPPEWDFRMLHEQNVNPKRAEERTAKDAKRRENRTRTLEV